VPGTSRPVSTATAPPRECPATTAEVTDSASSTAAGSLRGDLERYASDLAKDLGDPDTLALVPATIGTGGEQGAAACCGERQRQFEAILEREQARGEQPPTLERATDAVLAPLYYRAVFTDEPLTAAWTHRLVAHLLPD
jgi:hypothetical protein